MRFGKAGIELFNYNLNYVMIFEQQIIEKFRRFNFSLKFTI